MCFKPRDQFKSWTKPSRDVAEQKTVGVHTRGQCALFCDRLSPCKRFEITVIDMTMLCHMAMAGVDGH